MPGKQGIRSKQWLTEQSVHVFNTFGLDITMNQLADYLGVSRGRISHFFSTRDALFEAISQVYQYRLQRIIIAFELEYANYNFENVKHLFGNIMDNQYDYRCVILYAAGAGNSKSVAGRQIQDAYRLSKTEIRLLISKLVAANDLKAEILDQQNYDIFEFQFVNLFTSWVISKEIYYPNNTYPEMKPLFHKGLLNLFEPYLT